jgi:hypothetical protein
MPEEPQQTATAPNAKTRDDDARGTPKGAGVITPPHGGRIGNPPFEATDEQRKKVREYAKVFPPHAEHMIARLIGVSTRTLQRHLREEMDLGRAEMLAAVGAQVVNRAMNAEAAGPDGKPLAKGDLDAQKFILARLGGWTTKVEMTGKDGGPIRHASFDLSKLSEDEKRALLPVLDQLIESGEDDAGADD